MSITNKNESTVKRIICIACSTGGPRILSDIFSKLDKNIGVPIVIVQHMPDGFTKQLAERLRDISGLDVEEAEDGMEIKSGHVYVAKAGKHLKICKMPLRHVLKLTDEPLREGVRPCANYMFESLIDSDYDEIICFVLTGMGSDGSEGIKALYDRKNVKVYIQDEKSSVVYGMPGNVIKKDIPYTVINAEDIPEKLKSS